jgi:hypothetical protein
MGNPVVQEQHLASQNEVLALTYIEAVGRSSSIRYRSSCTRMSSLRCRE